MMFYDFFVDIFVLMVTIYHLMSFYCVTIGFYCERCKFLLNGDLN